MLKYRTPGLAHIISVSYIQSINKYLLRAHYVPEIVLVVGGNKMDKIKAGLPSWSSLPL